tara:strand:+ start:118 stop:312 length:195 start_codon:yes stop_codon:yes gene_type:complete
MKISVDKLKIFKEEGELRNYLKINGISGAAIEEHIMMWKSGSSEKSIEKVTMVATETDTTVETK